jgi:hypothetical protein
MRRTTMRPASPAQLRAAAAMYAPITPQKKRPPASDRWTGEEQRKFAMAEATSRKTLDQADLDHVLASIPTGRRGEELRIALSPYKGRHYLGLRVWYADDAGEMKPTSKGVNLKVELLPQILEGVSRAATQARADGLI